MTQLEITFNSDSRASQNAQILLALQRGQKLTPLDALNDFGCFRLGARVWDTRSVVGPFACAKEARRRQPFAGRRMGRSYATFNKRLGVVTCRKKVPVDIEKMIHQAVKKEG